MIKRQHQNTLILSAVDTWLSSLAVTIVTQPGYMESAGQTPEALWLTGDSFGWRGPWGTTYAANLRLLFQNLSENQWLTYAHSLNARPPMPWFNLRQMKDSDLRAIYRFVHQLGAAGTPAPAYVPPDKEPQPPYATFPAPPSQ